MLKNHMIVDYLIFVVHNCSDDATLMYFACFDCFFDFLPCTT